MSHPLDNDALYHCGCGDWHYKNELLTPCTAKFRATVRGFVQSKNGAVKELAREFEVSFSTVDGWWLGTARPHPLLQAQIMNWIEEHDNV